ncbi:MAG: ABC transporter permease [Anaerolinea sp.]|nr:ABC transporter permease [Anaerolinea sp.]
MKQFWTLVKQDLIVAARNWFLAAIAFMLLIFLALIWFLPERFDAQAAELVYDGTPGQAMQQTLLRLGADESSFYASRESLEAALHEQKKGIGVVIAGDLDALRYTFITQGHMAPQNLNLLGAALDSVAAVARGAAPPANLQLTLLRPLADPIPMNEAGVPIFLVFEVVALGFFLVAAIIFQEKQEGVIRAFRVSPANTLTYVLAKTAVFLILGVVYALLLLGLGLGFDAPFAPLLLLVILGSSMMTLFGIVVAVFFNNLSEWFFVGAFILIFFMLPTLSYAIPAFAPPFITWMPSYPLVFGARELLFPTGKSGFLLPTVGLLALYNVIALALAYWAVDRKLMRA